MLECCEEDEPLCRETDLDARGERVVRRLRHVGVVVRRNDVITSLRLAAQFECAVAKHLVHVHVDGCARAALNRIDGELIDVLARNDLVRRLHKQIADVVRKASRVHVRESRRLLHLRERHNEVRIELLSRDVEVLDGAHRLYAIVNIIGHFKVA